MVQKVLVIGAGIIGAFCAYALNAKGVKVSIIDKGRFGHGCSHGNCGLVSRSSVIPINMPGAPLKMLTSMLNPNPAAIKVNPFQFAFWPWAIKFQRACQLVQFKQTMTARNELHAKSYQLWQKFMQQENLACEWKELGQLHIFNTKKSFEHHQSLMNQCLEFGINAHSMIGKECQEIEPQLNMDHLYGGWFLPGNGVIRSDLVLKELHNLLMKRGVEVIEQEQVNGFTEENGMVKIAHTLSGKRIEADAFVVATGAWSSTQKLFKFKPIIQPAKGYSISLPKHHLNIKCPIVFKDHGVAATPYKLLTKIGSIVDFDGLNSQIDHSRAEYLLKTMEKYTFFECAAELTKQTWSGCRPMSADDKPYIGKYPTMKNAYLAAGHGMYGLTQAPGTADLISDMILGKKLSFDATPFSLERSS